jgi:hypothetical protein
MSILRFKGQGRLHFIVILSGCVLVQLFLVLFRMAATYCGTFHSERDERERHERI